MDIESRIYIAGHAGMVGSFLVEKLKSLGYRDLIYKSHQELDLRDQKAVQSFFEEYKPQYVFLIAGRVGGIHANINRPAVFLYDNLMIAASVIEASRLAAVKKLLNLGSSCIYPRFSPQPMKEEYLLSGSLEPTNEAYAIGKITGVKLCEFYKKQYGCNFVSAIPPNLYGPRDDFSPSESHVVSALIRKMHVAKIKNEDTVEIWGTGSARRELLFNKDLANGLIFLMKNYEDNLPVNIGTGEDLSIREIAELVKAVVGYEGSFVWNTTMPDGSPRKLMDSSRAYSMGWKPMTTFVEGLKETYEWYKENNP